MMAEGEVLVQTRELTRLFGSSRLSLFRQRKVVRAVDGVDMAIHRGESYGLVGESGCGKTTLGRLILGLIPPTRGQILYQGADVTALDKSQEQELRRKRQIIFQDPYSSLNPSFTVRQILHEGYRHNPRGSRQKEREDLGHLLEQVGMHPAMLRRYPHELSGGQRQRVGIARALSVDPEFIVADEPTSALDVSIQAQILNLFIELQQAFGLTYMFISHNLSVIRYMCNRIGVMYLGRIVEESAAFELFTHRLHPYTEALFSSIPQLGTRGWEEQQLITGDLPSPTDIPSGCRFHPRCPIAETICREELPELQEVSPDHYVACHLV